MKLFGAFRLLAILCVAALATGCASIKMVDVSPTKVVPPGKALVTFVRQSVYMGDGIPVDLWDGEHYIGVLKAGTIVQYLATPGDHLFLANAENWSYASGSLVEGKRYYLKANVFPGVMTARIAFGVAERTDDRIDQWHQWDAKAAPEAPRAEFEEAELATVQEAIQTFKSGAVKSFAPITDDQAF
jgi:hypothetical protein